MVYKVATLLLLFGSVSLAARGTDIFRWVDENGKIHFGDSVPDRYRREAKKLDSKGAEVTSAQRQQAEERLAKEKARAESLRKAREANSDVAQPSAAPTPAAPPVANNANACEEQLKKYLDSQTCFAPYMLKDGGVKPEAFQNCTEVKEPRGCWQSPHPAMLR
jgi:cobalamin-dependent methionine synthase I